MTERFHRPALRALAVLLCGAALAAPVAAQDQTAEFQPWRIPGWTFTPGVIFGTLVDSNVAIASPDVNKKTASDKMFELAPFGDLSYLSSRVSFSSGYRGTVQRYFDFGNLDGTDHRGYLTLRDRLTRRLTVFVTENYAQVPTTDRLELNGLPFQRTGARYNSLAGGLESRLTKSLDAIIRYEMTWVDFERKEDINLTGGVVNGIHGELSHRFSERLSGGVEYGARTADLNQGTKEIFFQDGGGVVRYRAGEATTFEAAAGVAHLLDRNTHTSKAGPYAKAGLVRRAERATFGIDFSRSYVPSLAFGGTNQSQELKGYFQMPLSHNRLYLQETASWRRTNPFVQTELPLDSIFLHNVIGYSVQRWFRVEGYYQFTTQDNRVAGGQISRHVGGLQFVVAEPMRIR